MFWILFILLLMQTKRRLIMVKTGKDLHNEQDLQNLVVGTINRMPLIKKDFRITDVIEIVECYSKDASFFIDDEMIREKVEDTLDLLQIRNRITCRNGVYHFLPFKVIGNDISEYLAEHPL